MASPFSRPVPVHLLATHHGFHADEVAAIVLCWAYPEKSDPMFPGISDANVTFVDAGRKTHLGGSADEAFVTSTGIMYVGCGKSPWDEHPDGKEALEPDGTKKPRKCAFSLVVETFDLQNNKEIQALNRYLVRVDGTATDTKRSLATVIKTLHNNRAMKLEVVKKWVEEKNPEAYSRILTLLLKRQTLEDDFGWAADAVLAKMGESEQTDDFTVDKIGELMRLQNPTRPELAAQWLEVATDALELDQLLFDNVTRPDYFASSTIVELLGRSRGKPQKIKIAFVASDDVRVHKFARTIEGGRVAVLVQRRTNGSVAIMTNLWAGVNVRDVARVLMRMEALRRGLKPPRWDEAKQEMTFSVWFHFETGKALFNGTNTTIEVEPTKLNMVEVVSLVKMALSAEPFPAARMETCLQGICSSTRQDPCDRYKFGLGPCQTIRWEAHRDREAEAAAASGK